MMTQVAAATILIGSEASERRISMASAPPASGKTTKVAKTTSNAAEPQLIRFMISTPDRLGLRKAWLISAGVDPPAIIG